MDFTVTQPHSLGLDEARRRVRTGIAGCLPSSLKLIDAQWTEATGVLVAHVEARGVPLAATTTVGAHEVTTHVSGVPWYGALAIPAAKAEIQRSLATLLR